MSFPETAQDDLLQEIQQIQSTLDLEVSKKALEDSRAKNDDSENNLSSEGGRSVGSEFVQKKHQKNINDYDEDSVFSKLYVYQTQELSDDDSSNSSFESTYSNHSSYAMNSSHPTTFGHFFQALETNDESGKTDDINSEILPDSLESSIILEPTWNQLFSYSTPLPSLHSKVKERIALQSSGTMMAKTSNNKNDENMQQSAAESVISTPKTEDGQLSANISIPSTYSSKQKKEKINMTNLYVERIFRNFHSRNKNPTVADANKFDTRNLKTSAPIGRLENLLQLNRNYQEILVEQLKQAQVAIQTNRKAQDELSEPLGSSVQRLGFGSLGRACLGRFKPYFKDRDGTWPPENEDTVEIKKQMKVLPFSKGSKPWRVRETKALKDGIYQNNLEKRLEPLLHKLKQYDKDYKERLKTNKDADRSGRTGIVKKIAEVKALPKEEILRDSYEIDYFKLAKNFLRERDEFECQLHWCNVVHPAINQSKFTKEEDIKILTLSKKYKNCHWEEIAKFLNTCRTPVQCLQRFQRTLNKDVLKTTWDEDDDKKLMEAVKKFGRGWILISHYLGNRTSDQCIHRWEKTVNPAIKRGKWTDEEDSLLLEAVRIHGTKNWKYIKLYVPGRTDSQCRDRYMSSLDPTINWGPFSQEEDDKLLRLVEKYGVGKWSSIARDLEDRKDAQVWRRYKVLKSLEYHTYRRDTIWKKNSVLTYFMHRDEEKRDYDLKEMDVKNIIPSVNRFEKMKAKSAKSKLEAEGYSEEEIKHELARMTYSGDFYKRKSPKRKRKSVSTKQNTAAKLSSESQPNEKWPRRKRKKDNNKRMLSPDLVESVKDIISNTDDPKRIFGCSSDTTGDSQEEGATASLILCKPNLCFRKVRLTIPPQHLKTVENFKTRIRASIKALHNGKIFVENLQADIEKCYQNIFSSRPELTMEIEELLESAGKQVDDFLNRQNELSKQMIEQEEFDIIVLSTRQKRVPKRKDKPVYVVEQAPPNKRKKVKPKKVVELRATSTRSVATAKESPEIKQEIVEHVVDESPIPSIDFNLNENELLTEQSSLIGHTAQPSSSSGSNTVVVTDKLTIFTLLLQALHVDTAGVMRSLPENHLADSIKSRNSDKTKEFPFCYPLSPNAATLKGFRTLLLCRRRLSELVNKQKANIGNVSGTLLDSSVFRKTPMYDALSKRFRSMFIWPAFLATFMPRHVESAHKPQQTPMKMNPNKRMLITPDKVRPTTSTPAIQTLPPGMRQAILSTSKGTSSHTISSKSKHRALSTNTLAKNDISQSKQNLSNEQNSVTNRSHLFPAQNNISTISTSAPYLCLTKINQSIQNSSIVTNPESKAVTGQLAPTSRKRRQHKSTTEKEYTQSGPSWPSPPKQRKALNKILNSDSRSKTTSDVDEIVDKDISGDRMPTLKLKTSNRWGKSISKPRKTRTGDGRRAENMEVCHDVEIEDEKSQDDASSDVFIPRTKSRVVSGDDDDMD